MHKLSLLILLFFVCSCANNNTKVLLSNINKAAHKKFSAKDAEIIVLYGLPSNNNTCLHNQDYVKTLNNIHDNNQVIQKIKTFKGNIDLQQKRYKIKQILFELNKKYKSLKGKNIKMLPLLQPMYNPILTSKYGNRYLKNSVKKHSGIDLYSKYNDVYASAFGRITLIARLHGYGNTIIIDHGGGISTKYAHLSKITTIHGKKVVKGEKIGIQGITGNTTGKHLHFEIILNGKAVDPLDFIKYDHYCIAK